MNRKFPFVFACVSLAFLCLTSCTQTGSDRVYQQTSDYSFEDTIINLDIAISEHNYRVIHKSNIGQAIRDRGVQDFPLSVVINFCNITYAQEMLLINPDLINDMPCTVTVREQENKVIVGTRLMDDKTRNNEQNSFATKINQNLISIVEATVE
jgi:uncharacterized protein (DUF302 family)